MEKPRKYPLSSFVSELKYTKLLHDFLRLLVIHVSNKSVTIQTRLEPSTFFLYVYNLQKSFLKVNEKIKINWFL